MGLSGLCLMVTAVLAGGCASSPRIERRAVAPKPPPFLSGPVSVLLTNVDGFGAHVVMETRVFADRVETVSGKLLGRGNKLLFAPESHVSAGKSRGGGDASFIWDVAENSGYVLNEPLQGYAPMISNVRFTNLVVRPRMVHSAPEKVEGHSCEQEEVVVTSSDGSVVTFRVWRAADLKGFPVRINLATNSTPPTLSFSQIHLETPADKLFLPPDGFAKYDSVETMLNELAARQQFLKHGKPQQGTGETQRVGGREGSRYKGGQ